MEKYYNIFIRQYSIIYNDYVVYVDYIKTKDIYHWIGYKYCTTIEEIKRIDYLEITKEQYDKGKRKTYYKGKEVLEDA